MEPVILALFGNLLFYAVSGQAAGKLADEVLKTAIAWGKDKAQKKIGDILGETKTQKKLLAAFQHADSELIARFQTGDGHRIAQAVTSYPLAAEDNLKKLAELIPQSLDRTRLQQSVKRYFETNWPDQFEEGQINEAAYWYVLSLFDGMANAFPNMLPHLTYILGRDTSVDTRATRDMVSDLSDDFQRFSQEFAYPQSPAPMDEAALQHAQAKLAELPLDDVPADPAPLPPGSRPIPFRPNPLFVGRVEEMKQVAAWMKGGGTTAIGQVGVASGMGGIGKTQLAAEFAHRYGQYFAGGVFWLGFDIAENIPAEIAACGGPEGMKLAANWDALPFDEQVNRVLAAWSSALPRLLVFDNCEHHALLDQWLPRTGGARVLVTSRQVGWPDGMDVRELALGVLNRDESIALLRGFRDDLSAGDPMLDAIADELGDLALALHIAGSYLGANRHDVSAESYLHMLQGTDILQHLEADGDHSPTRHDLSVAKTFQISLDKLDQNDETDARARRTLAYAAAFAPGEVIPRDLLKLCFMVDQEVEPGEEPQTPNLSPAINRLRALGLTEEDADGDARLHRLLARFVQGAHLEADASSAVERVVQGVAGRINDDGLPHAMLPILPHLVFLTNQALARRAATGARLANELGFYLQLSGRYPAARPYYEEALDIHRETLGARHPHTAGSLNNLGGLLRAMGELPAARPYFEEALDIHRETLGARHPDTATSLNNLGSLLHDMGELPAARPYYEEALDIRRETLGARHPHTATSLNNLGVLLRAMGELPAARPYYEEALDIRRETLGARHPDTATSLNNLGVLLHAMGELPAARPYFEEALAILGERLGREHPTTQTVRRNLESLSGEDKKKPGFWQKLGF
jgi:tetratricopeptide (TPR) repeat protein